MRIMPRFPLLFVLLGVMVCCDSGKDVTPPAANQPDKPVDTVTASKSETEDTAAWTEYRGHHISLRLPDELDTEYIHSISGAYVVITKSNARFASLTFMPVTTQPDLKDALINHRTDLAINALELMFPKFDVGSIEKRWEKDEQDKPVFTFDVSDDEKPTQFSGRVYLWPEAGVIVYLIAGAATSDQADSYANQITSTFQSTWQPVAPLDIQSPMVEVDVPDEWILLEDWKKRYWASPDGKAFILVSNPFPTGGEPRLSPSYGTTADLAGIALKGLESLNGREFSFHDSKLRFDTRLWCVKSIANASVNYNSGTYHTEMWRWIDPRTEKYQRVYFGGMSQSDFDKARAIAETVTFAPGVSEMSNGSRPGQPE
jgi:hypothetical protein